MSNHISPAQKLPAHIERLVIQYLAKETRLPFTEALIKMDELKGLFHVCSSWRQAALEYLWNTLQLTIDDRENIVTVKCPRWINKHTLPDNVDGQVKRLIICVDISAIMNGVAYILLNEFLGCTSTFPSSRKLSIWIHDRLNRSDDLAEGAVHAIAEFSQMLNSIVQVNTKVEVAYNRGRLQNGAKGDALVRFAESMCSTPSSKVPDINVAKPGYSSTLDCATRLSSLKVDDANSIDILRDLVHKCSNTIMDLEVTLEVANWLLYDENGNEVTYPNLMHLKLVTTDYDFSDLREYFPNIVPFPALKSLRIPASYPFADDVAFRGNKETLEYLHICVDTDTVSVLSKSRELDNRYKSLRRVLVTRDKSISDFSGVPKDDMINFLNNIAGSSSIVKFNNKIPIDCLIAAVKQGRGFEHIQLLDVRRNQISLSELLDLLMVLPSLSKITCDMVCLGSKLDHVADEELPDYITSRYKNLGKNLHTLWITTQYSTSHGETVKRILLLALVCPKLLRLKRLKEVVSEYHSIITKELLSGPFSKYALQLNRFLSSAF